LTVRDDVIGRLNGRDAPSIVFCGHLHARASCAEGNVLQLTFGALIESPSECAIVEIETGSESVSVRRRSHQLESPDKGVGPLFVPAEEIWEFTERGWWCLTQTSSELVA
jgi:hypothetical protein